MSGAILSSQFLTRLLTSGEEDIECSSMQKRYISSTACEMTMLILSISVTFNVTCLTVTSLIMKSCQQLQTIHSCSFYNAMHQQIYGMVVDFRVHLVIVNLSATVKDLSKLGSICESYAQMKKGTVFLLST